MKKILIIHHSVDNDGVVSAALVKYLMLKNSFIPNGEEVTFDFKGMNNDFNPEMKRKDVKAWSKKYEYLVVTDFSLPPKTMNYCLALFETRFLWFDHHKTNIDESKKYKYCHANGMRSTDKSAILQAYCYFEDPFLYKYRDKTEIPLVLGYLSAWDSWTYDYFGYSAEECQKLNVAFTSYYKLNIDSIYSDIEKLISPKNNYLVYELIRQGEVLWEHDAYRAEREINNNGDTKWVLRTNEGDRKAVAVYMVGGTTSKMFKQFIGTDVQNAIVIRPNLKNKWTISLYNIDNSDDFHCGEFLKKKYGGGGHSGAAGASFKPTEMLKIIKEKIL
jgi:oligoribonuclease NrnB/cAMP/cGMP phosphodiesterase (DHH superfamily)